MLKFTISPTNNVYSVTYNKVDVGELYQEIDGYYVWDPADLQGYLSAWFLRDIANKLDDLNRDWNEELVSAIEGKQCST